MKIFATGAKREDSPVTFVVDVKVDIETDISDLAIAANKHVSHPRTATKDTMLLTDDSLEEYDAFVDSVICNVLGEGMCLVNAGDSGFQSPDSYTVYPRFKIADNDEGDRFVLLFRLFDHDKRHEVQSKFAGVVRFEPLDIAAHCVAEIVDHRGSNPVYRITAFRNTLEVSEHVTSKCDEFKQEVAHRLHRTEQFVAWGEAVAAELGLRFSFEGKDVSKNPLYYFYSAQRSNPLMFQEGDFMSASSYDEFKQIVTDGF